MTTPQASETKLHLIKTYEDFPTWLNADDLASFLYDSLKPFEDPLAQVKQGVSDALSPDSPISNFVIIAHRDEQVVGAVVMLKTSMKGYIPENLLLYIAVNPSCRGMGLGKRMLERTIQECESGIKLHVEYDNPAKRLYERVGFVNKYADMRYSK